MAGDAFPQIDGIKGESTDDKRDKWIECTAVHQDLATNKLVMRRAGYAVLLLVVAASAYAAGAKTRAIFPPRLSGDQLIADLLGNADLPKSEQSPKILYAQRFAEGYVAGVVDATEGSVWCAPAMKRHEVDDRVWTELYKRPRGSLPGNAGALRLEQYVAKFPCP